MNLTLFFFFSMVISYSSFFYDFIDFDINVNFTVLYEFWVLHNEST